MPPGQIATAGRRMPIRWARADQIREQNRDGSGKRAACLTPFASLPAAWTPRRRRALRRRGTEEASRAVTGVSGHLPFHRPRICTDMHDRARVLALPGGREIYNGAWVEQSQRLARATLRSKSIARQSEVAAYPRRNGKTSLRIGFAAAFATSSPPRRRSQFYATSDREPDDKGQGELPRGWMRMLPTISVACPSFAL